MTTPPVPTCPACGRAAPLTGPCGQCGADLTALQILWALPLAPAPATTPVGVPSPGRTTWLAPLVVGLGVGLGAGVLGSLRLAGGPAPPAAEV
ncbi:MAG: hypothetical protein VKS61_13625, partial [Candidatus Sericytochromatia bacterium]|nr:hypothetical protein [Candidatus Sericytochromatia bacterium]